MVRVVLACARCSQAIEVQRTSEDLFYPTPCSWCKEPMQIAKPGTQPRPPSGHDWLESWPAPEFIPDDHPPEAA